MIEIEGLTVQYGSTVALDDATNENMEMVPVVYRDSQLLEWWARYLLSRQDWAGLIKVILWPCSWKTWQFAITVMCACPPPARMISLLIIRNSIPYFRMNQATGLQLHFFYDLTIDKV